MSDHMSKLNERLARIVASHAGALAAASTNPRIGSTLDVAHMAETGEVREDRIATLTHRAEAAERELSEVHRGVESVRLHNARVARDAANDAAALWRERCNKAEARVARAEGVRESAMLTGFDVAVDGAAICECSMGAHIDWTDARAALDEAIKTGLLAQTAALATYEEG